MQRFLLKVILFLTPFLLLAYPADRLLSHWFAGGRGLNYVSDGLVTMDSIYSGELRADVAVYGSSRAWRQFDAALLSRELGADVYNFGFDGHNFWLQYLRHKLYVDRNPAPRTILLSVDATTLQKRPDLLHYRQFLPYMLGDEDIREFTRSYVGFKEYDYYLPATRYVGEFGFVSQRLRYALKPPRPSTIRDRGYLCVDGDWAPAAREQLQLVTPGVHPVDTATVSLLDRFAGECAAAGIELIFVHAPWHELGYPVVANYPEHEALLRGIAERHGVPYLDYLRHPLSKNADLFYNATHLNCAGAAAFTRTLVEDLRRRGLAAPPR